jgi:Protein of unknown function (DUF2924)
MPNDDLALSTCTIELEISSRDLLIDRWRSLYRCDPPKGIGKRLLIGAIAFELQMRQTGRSRSRLRRRLEKHAYKIFESNAAHIPDARKPMPGTRLIREWNGSIHTVDIVDNGYVWNGDKYRSLSAIARAITGARWSGPRFFGIRAGDDR